jgi:hypothetical protein
MNGSKNKTWCIDLGMFQHFTFQKDVFSYDKIISKKSVYMGDNFVQEVVGMRSVHLNNVKVGECEVKGVLHKVLHVFNLVKNFFSISKAIVQIFKVEFQ